MTKSLIGFGSALGAVGILGLSTALLTPINAANLPDVSTINTTDFVTTWRTTGANQTITLPIRGGVYDLDCDADGVYDQTGRSGASSCTYANIGDHHVRLSGAIEGFGGGCDASRHANTRPELVGMDQWGTLKISNFESMFCGTSNLHYRATDKPDLSHATSLNYMFHAARGTFTNSFNTWDTSTIRSLRGMFYGSTFNQPIDNWDTSNVTDMSSMFDSSTFNQPIDAWNTSDVTDMGWMFRHNRSFNQDLNSWDTSKVTNMVDMFGGAGSFNGKISDWDTSNVVNMGGMFWGAGSFNQPIGNWNVEKVTNMSSMLRNLSSFNQDISAWNPKNVRSFWAFLGGWDDAGRKEGDLRKFSTENYEKLLRAWQGKIQPNVPIWLGGQFCDAADAKKTLLTTNLIHDYGRACAPQQPLLAGSTNVVITLVENTQDVGLLEPQLVEDEQNDQFTFEIVDTSPDKTKLELKGRKLLFVSPLPDFEKPADADANNVYKIDIKVTNTAVNKHTIVSYEIRVTDTDESINLSHITPLVSRKGVAINLADVGAKYTNGQAFSGILTHDALAKNLDETNPAAGKYQLVYTARDANGNQGTAGRQVEITDADALKAQLDRANLQATIENKTDASIATMRQVQQEAQKVFDNFKATQAEIDQATQALKTAIDNLVDKSQQSGSSTSSSGGGFSGGGLFRDYCPQGDFSPSYYDNTCSKPEPVEKDEKKPESENAYDWAFKHAITSKASLEDARLYDVLTRKELAKMLTVFTQKFTKRAPIIGKVGCHDYADLTGAISDDLKQGILTSCELEVMGLYSDGKTPLQNFMPHKVVSRAELITTLSRVLYGNTYDNNQKYGWWKRHMQNFIERGILNKMDHQSLATRNTVFLMMYRVMGHIQS